MLLANGSPGVEIVKFLSNLQDTEIVALYLCGNDNVYHNKIISLLDDNKKIHSAEDFESAAHLKYLDSLDIDILITVYWPYLLKEEVFNKAQKTINMHPSLLPINRGWYPHVHSLIDGSKAGVTLHSIDKNADTGAIWAQKEIEVLATDTSKTLYLRLQDEIISLFKDNWEFIKNDRITPHVQSEDEGNYHAKGEINTLNEINLSTVQTIEETINFLRARSFGETSYSYFIKNGKKIYINIKLSLDSNFN